MIRHVFERGLASVVARFMLDGSAEAVFERIAKAGALPPAELEKLRRETLTYLEKVRDEGAPYSDMVLAALREVAAHLPDARGLATSAGRVAVQVVARSAEVAAAQAREMADRLAAEQARAASKTPASQTPASQTPASQTPGVWDKPAETTGSPPADAEPAEEP